MLFFNSNQGPDFRPKFTITEEDVDITAPNVVGPPPEHQTPHSKVANKQETQVMNNKDYLETDDGEDRR